MSYNLAINLLFLTPYIIRLQKYVYPTSVIPIHRIPVSGIIQHLYNVSILGDSTWHSNFDDHLHIPPASLVPVLTRSVTETVSVWNPLYLTKDPIGILLLLS